MFDLTLYEVIFLKLPVEMLRIWWEYNQTDQDKGRKKDLYLCFIDKAETFEMYDIKNNLSKLDLFGKYINIYRDQISRIWIKKKKKEFSNYTKIEKDVRHGCLFVSYLFN